MALSNKGEFIINNNANNKFVAKSLKPSFESLAASNSGRTDDGTMHIYWILRKIRKLEIEMAPCSSQEASAILSLVQGREYTITYWDILDNAEKTINVYTSTSSADCYSGVIRNGLWTGLTFNAIELAGEA